VRLTLGCPAAPRPCSTDRILQEAIVTDGDARWLCDLFGLSIQLSSRYTDAIAEPAVPNPT
jgi:hypothetical protein